MWQCLLTGCWQAVHRQLGEREPVITLPTFDSPGFAGGERQRDREKGTQGNRETQR